MRRCSRLGASAAAVGGARPASVLPRDATPLAEAASSPRTQVAAPKRARPLPPDLQDLSLPSGWAAFAAAASGRSEWRAKALDDGCVAALGLPRYLQPTAAVAAAAAAAAAGSCCKCGRERQQQWQWRGRRWQRHLPPTCSRCRPHPRRPLGEWEEGLRARWAAAAADRQRRCDGYPAGPSCVFPLAAAARAPGALLWGPRAAGRRPSAQPRLLRRCRCCFSRFGCLR